eukprot:4384683-Amphidinium_carterae.2
MHIDSFLGFFLDCLCILNVHLTKLGEQEHQGKPSTVLRVRRGALVREAVHSRGGEAPEVVNVALRRNRQTRNTREPKNGAQNRNDIERYSRLGTKLTYNQTISSGFLHAEAVEAQGVKEWQVQRRVGAIMPRQPFMQTLEGWLRKFNRSMHERCSQTMDAQQQTTWIARSFQRLFGLCL